MLIPTWTSKIPSCRDDGWNMDWGESTLCCLRTCCTFGPNSDLASLRGLMTCGCGSLLSHENTQWAALICGSWGGGLSMTVEGTWSWIWRLKLPANANIQFFHLASVKGTIVRTSLPRWELGVIYLFAGC